MDSMTLAHGQVQSTHWCTPVTRNVIYVANYTKNPTCSNERLYISKIASNNDGLTYIALCVKFPKGIPIGTLIALETASSNLGTERVSTPSVTPKVMYVKLVAAQMEICSHNQRQKYIHVCTIVLSAVNFHDIMTAVIELVTHFITET